MKITNSDIIKSGERELIDSIIGDLDWDAIEKIVKDRHKLQIQDDVEYRQGDIIVHNNQVAYRLDFDVKMTLSVVFDREGNCLSLAASEDNEEIGIGEESPIAGDGSDPSVSESKPEPDTAQSFSPADIPTADPENTPRDNFSKMASHIAEMISEINDD